VTVVVHCFFRQIAKWRLPIGLLILFFQGSVFAQAQQPVLSQLPLVIGTGPAGTSYSVPIQTLLFFTALSFLPAVLLMMT